MPRTYIGQRFYFALPQKHILLRAQKSKPISRLTRVLISFNNKKPLPAIVFNNIYGKQRFIFYFFITSKS